MRIVLVVPAFPKLSETFIVNKFIGLLERGWDVHVVCGKSQAEEWQYFPELERRGDVRRRVHVVWPVRPRPKAGLLVPVAYLWSLLQRPGTVWQYLREGLRRFGFDVLRRWYLDMPFLILHPDLVHFEFGALAVDRMYIKDLLCCRVVVSFRGYDINFIGLEEPDYYRVVWHEADALHVLGHDLWRRAVRRGCPVEKPHVLIPPAIDTDFFDPGERVGTGDSGNEQRPLHILSIGRLEWKKGYEYALQAVRMLLDCGVPCVYTIVGDGAYREAVAFAIDQLGLTAHVRLVGTQSRDEVKAHLVWSDVFLHAAVSEGFCNAVLEAQSMQVPVVCSDADGLSENVLDRRTGFVVPRRDPVALFEKLARLAEHPALRQQMGAAGRQHVIDRFQIVQQGEQFDDFYRRVFGLDDRCREVSGKGTISLFAVS